MTKPGMGNLEMAIALGAGVGFLAARLIGLDIGLALVAGALIGSAGAILRAQGRQDDGTAPRD
jgi:hypothetical protein